MIPIKNDEEIAAMREVGQKAAIVLAELEKATVPGVSTYELDQLGREVIENLGAKSACFKYKVGSKIYPAYTCISLNEEVVHGIGRQDVVVKEGDLVSLDVCVDFNGFIGDNAKTVIVGEPNDQESVNLVKTTEEALNEAIKMARVGKRIGDISSTVQNYVEKRGFSVVRDFVGHGVGRSMHEEPQIPNFGRKNTGPKIYAGMVFAIEPMVNAGSHNVEYASDGWTAVTCDKKLSAHFEHTVLITDSGPEILTFLKK